MNVALRSSWTPDAFLAWEERQEQRHEFDGFRPVAMTGGTWAHALIQANLIVALGRRLAGRPCRVYGSVLKIRVAGSIRYPDAFVACTPAPRRSTVIDDPVVIFEIISDSTARTDRIVKNREYAATPSVRRYVLLEQDAVEGTMFARTPAGEWLGHLLGPDTVLHMPEIGVDLPLAELYAGLGPAEPEAAPPPEQADA
jgi:Uma2 family endonuclease